MVCFVKEHFLVQIFYSAQIISVDAVTFEISVDAVTLKSNPMMYSATLLRLCPKH